MDSNEIKIREEVILVLVESGLKLFKIDGRIYVVDWVETATPTLWKHKIKGKDITQMISETTQFSQSHIDPSAIENFVRRVQALSQRTIEFHKDYKFKYYEH